MKTVVRGVCLYWFITIIHGIQFSFAPSPNITILQSAVYQCTLDGVAPSDSISVQWVVNSISSSSPSWSSYASTYSIVADGIGTHSSTLSIPGDAALNVTTVTCLAAGIANGKGYVNTSSDTLYMQGKPGGVDLYCTLFSLYTIKCNWSIPYTLPGVDITGYNININSGTSNNLIVKATVNETQYTYNVSEFGVYNISVVAVIGDDLEGEIDMRRISVPKEVVSNWSYQLSYKDQTRLILMLEVDEELIYQINACKFILHIISLLSEFSMTYNLSNNLEIDFSSENTSFDERKDFLVLAIELELVTGLIVQLGMEMAISTFNVQALSISNDDKSASGSETVCFKCVYITGTLIPHCYIQYNSTSTCTSGHLYIYNNSTNCTSVPYTGEYDVLVYDIEKNNTIYSDHYAYSTRTLITGLEKQESTSIPTTVVSSYTMNTATLIPTTTDEEKAAVNFKIVVGVVCGIVFGSAVALIIVPSVISLYVILRKKWKSNFTMNCPPTQSLPQYTDPPTLQITPTNASFNAENMFPHDVEHSGLSRSNHPNQQSELQQGGYETLVRPDNSTGQYKRKAYTSEIAHQHKSPTGPYSTLNKKEQSSNPVKDVSTSVDNQLTDEYLEERLVSRIPHKWREVGTALVITPPRLQEIRNAHPTDDVGTIRGVIQEWKMSGGKTTRQFNKEILELVLNSM